MLLWCTTAAAQHPSRTVLTIHFGSESFPSNPVLDGAIRETLRSRVDAPIDYFAEYLKSDTLPPERASDALADYIRTKFHARSIDLVIAMTDQSLRFVLDHRALFPGAPVVFYVATVPPNVTQATGAGVTGVMVSNAYGATLKQALVLHPATRRIYIVANSPDQAVNQAVRNEFHHASLTIPIAAIEADTVASLLRQVRAVPQQSLIIYVWHTSDEREW